MRDQLTRTQDWSPEGLALWTEDAYMADRYGASAWLRVARFLKAEGFTKFEAEQILRSKHMRWAHDAKLTAGEPNSADFKRYYEQHEAQIRMDAEAWS